MGTPAPGCNGTVYNILKEGSGAEVVKGSKVTVHATGVVKETGKKFWSTKDPGQQPFSYKAGVGEVIKGCAAAAAAAAATTAAARRRRRSPRRTPPLRAARWDQGLLGMKLGEERQVIIPGAEGYGAAGFPAWGIPPDGTLDFTLEVLKIQ